MKHKSTIYSLIGAVCLTVGLSVINPMAKDINKDNKNKDNNIAVSVVSYNQNEKANQTEVVSGQSVSTTMETITSYATGSVISTGHTEKDDKGKAAVTPKPTVKPNPRKEIVKLAKKYKGKITYLWGGKPTDAQIAGKGQPKQLDCSGFIQFVYSKYNKKRIDALGSTIAIAGLPEIKKKQLKAGDIGLRNGTGSLYYDADGKSYYEPALAESANKTKVKLYDKKIEDKKEKKKKLKKKIKDKKSYISDYKNKKELLNDEADVTDSIEVTDETESEEEDLEEIQEEKEKLKQEAEKKAEEAKKKIKEYEQKIKKCKKDIETFSKKIKKYDKDLKKLKKKQKKYKEDIEESIDHVGIYCGKNKKGKAVWCHCSSSKKGVVYEVTDIFTHYYSTENYVSK